LNASQENETTTKTAPKKASKETASPSIEKKSP
jgi:hypothetical protein